MSCDLRSFEVEVNSAICKGCGYCSQVCSLGVFDRSDRFNPIGYQPLVAAQPERCMGCLRCLYICPDFCVTIREAVGK
jgi:NAD-dependent dihydropyrimidine dehydrogenase PreA subunit